MKRDLRKYARQTNVRLGIGFVLLLLLVGDGLIYALYGRNAAISGLVCIGAGLAPVGLIGLALYIVDVVVRKANEE